MWQQVHHIVSSMNNDSQGYAMFLGRWQPLHDGHKQLFKQALDAGKKICIMIRDMPVDQNNPFTTQQVWSTLAEHFEKERQTGQIIILSVPNITSINFGRGVGYDIIEHIPPENIASISATEIRKNMGN